MINFYSQIDKQPKIPDQMFGGLPFVVQLLQSGEDNLCQ